MWFSSISAPLILRLACLALTLAGCSAAPAPSLDGKPPSTAPTRTVGIEIAADRFGLEPDQLIPIEDGFATVGTDSDGRLQLRWIKPTDVDLELVTLATLDEVVAAGSSMTSLNVIVCPNTLDLTHKWFVLGQAPATGGLQLQGPPAVGGGTDGVYLFVIDPSASDAALTLIVGGRQMAHRDAGWAEMPASVTSAPGDEPCSPVPSR